MSEKVKKFLSWWNDGIEFREFIALLIISIFGYSIYIICNKMMGIGLDVNDIELYKIINSNVLVILCFYFGGYSAEKIIDSIFNKKSFNDENINNNINNTNFTKY